MAGFSDRGAVLVNETNDGVPLDKLWQEIEDVTKIWNTEKTVLASMISYKTTVPADAVPQSLEGEEFREASEYGVPQSISPPATYLKTGYSWADVDAASRYTWKWLRDASAEQVRSQVTRILEADERYQQKIVFSQLFTNVASENDWGHTVFPVWSGDGLVPPRWAGKSFSGSHNHFIVSGNATLDSADIEDAARHITEHGYGDRAGSQLLILANNAEAEQIMTWRSGVESRPGGPKARHDFIPSSVVPPYLTDKAIIGALPPEEVADGIPCLGSYGHCWLLQSHLIPQGWLAVVASGGANSDRNPFAVREHANPAYRGLREIPGPFQRYPIIDMFWARGIGCGTRHRGAAVVIEVKESGIYEIPDLNL